MGEGNRTLYILTFISGMMFSMGILLTLFISLPVAVWNFLQLGGLFGLAVFGIPYRFSKRKGKE